MRKRRGQLGVGKESSDEVLKKTDEKLGQRPILVSSLMRKDEREREFGRNSGASYNDLRPVSIPASEGLLRKRKEEHIHV